MSRLLIAVLLLVAGAAGYLAGRSGIGGGRAGGRETVATKRSEPRAIQLPAEEMDRLYKQSRLVTELADENRRLRSELAELRPPESDEPVKGERLPDGRIVGGARFGKGFQLLALGFMDTILSGFIKEANLTPEQEKRVREEIRTRSTEMMEALADFTNGDVTGDAAYDALSKVSDEAMKVVQQLLDERQREVFEAFRTQVKGIMHAQVTGGELALLHSELDLDSSQEKKVKAILSERYRRVQARIPFPLPNVFFKVVRSERDGDIYQETAAEIMKLLTPRQAALYDGVEEKAATQPFAYRNMLAPK